MIISCPECSGKLSSAAPSCPHCGFVQKAGPAAPVPASAPAAAAPVPPPAPVPELIPPSEAAIRNASKRTWSEWRHSAVWKLLIGAVIIVVAIGILVLVFLLANRMNNEPSAPQRIKPSEPVNRRD